MPKEGGCWGGVRGENKWPSNMWMNYNLWHTLHQELEFTSYMNKEGEGWGGERKGNVTEQWLNYTCGTHLHIKSGSVNLPAECPGKMEVRRTRNGNKWPSSDQSIELYMQHTSSQQHIALKEGAKLTAWMSRGGEGWGGPSSTKYTHVAHTVTLKEGMELTC